MPLVELVGGKKTSPETVARAKTLLGEIGMKGVAIEHEIEAFVADRLMEALWREALWLVNDGVATVTEIDDIMRYGFGLRWAQMGLFQTYRIAGGEAGMRHFLHQFGPALKWPWTKLTDVPDLSEDLIDRIATQSDEQAGDLTIRDLERIRDDNLVAHPASPEGRKRWRRLGRRGAPEGFSRRGCRPRRQCPRSISPGPCGWWRPRSDRPGSTTTDT